MLAQDAPPRRKTPGRRPTRPPPRTQWPRRRRAGLTLTLTLTLTPCSGHADAGLGAQKTLGFTSEDTGEIATVRPAELAEMLGAHSPRSGGRLELVFLNGCCSEELGRAVRARVGLWG